MDKKNNVASLINAVINHDAKRVNTLLNAGTNPCASVDKAAITPLHFAAQVNAITIVPLLLLAGANLHAKTKPEGQTPLDVACQHRHGQMIDLLISYDAQSRTEH